MFAMLRECPECGVAAGEAHVQACSFHQRYEAARGPLFEWLASLPAEYERLKALAAANDVADVGFDESHDLEARRAADDECHIGPAGACACSRDQRVGASSQHEPAIERKVTVARAARFINR